MSSPASRILPCLALGLLLIPGDLPASRIELVSAAGPGLLSDSGGGASTVSANGLRTVSSDGRFTVFTSVAANLVPGQVDTNQASDVFLYDRNGGKLTLVSHAAGSGSGAVTAHGSSDQATISADGSHVAYVSTATDLVAGQVAGPSPNQFLWSRAGGVNVLVSHTAASAVMPAGRISGSRAALSRDGSRLVFASAGPDLVAGQAGTGINLFLFDAATGANVLITHAAAAAATTAGGHSDRPVLSADGRFAAYDSNATSLVSGYTSESPVSTNVYLWDRAKGTSTLISHIAGQPLQGGSFSQDASISADGRWIAYSSLETGLVAGVTDGNGAPDVFLYDRNTGANGLVDRPRDATAATPVGGADTPVLSGDGNWIAFSSANLALGTGPQGEPACKINLYLTERATGRTVLVTHNDGEPAGLVEGSAESVALSDDGRWIAYGSLSPSLAPGDGNETSDIFVYDRFTDLNTLVSHRAGSQTSAAGQSSGSSLSADGRFAAFSSTAPDLDSGIQDGNARRDVFLHDRTAGTNVLISKRAAGLPSLSANGNSAAAGAPGTAISGDGRWVAFTSSATHLVAGQVDTNGGTDVFLRDRTNGITILVSHASSSAATAGNGSSDQPAVSDDGRWVTFASTATDLAAGMSAGRNPSNIFLFDRTAGTTVLVSHSSVSPLQAGNSGSVSPLISSDGARIVYLSGATDLVGGAAYPVPPSNVFLYDRITGTTKLVSHASGLPLSAANGASMAPRILADGGGVLFESLATNLAAGQSDINTAWDLFFFALSGEITLISRVNGSAATAGNGGAVSYTVSHDGRWVLFDDWSTDLVLGVVSLGGTNVFLHDRQSGVTSLVSHAAGNPDLAVGDSEAGDLSADGGWIAFNSGAANLVSGQASGSPLWNVFLQDRATGTTVLVSHAAGQPAGSPCCRGGASRPRLSGDGSKVVYSADFTNLVAGQITQDSGVFLYDRLAGEASVVSHTAGAPTRTGNGRSETADMTADGGAIVFNSTADDLVAGDFNDAKDVFVYTDGLPGAFYTLPPCRLLDTRLPADGPAIASGQTKIAQAHGVCGIPDTAKALAVNVAIVEPTGNGYLTLHPGDALPTATSSINFSAGETLANNAAQRLAVNTTGTVALTPLVSGNGAVHVVIDVAGYFE